MLLFIHQRSSLAVPNLLQWPARSIPPISPNVVRDSTNHAPQRLHVAERRHHRKSRDGVRPVLHRQALAQIKRPLQAVRRATTGVKAPKRPSSDWHSRPRTFVIQL
ncbi:hypothetical protein ARSEF1564_010175, partial [Beauveria bassiana]